MYNKGIKSEWGANYMSKKKKPKPLQKMPIDRPSTPSEVHPDFRRETEEQYGNALDLTGASDEMKLSAMRRVGPVE